MTGDQFGLININMGPCEPDVEEEVMSDVASYGKQLGRVEDAMVVLLTYFQPDTLTKKEEDAINALKTMIDDIADRKEKHKRAAYRLRRT